MSAFYTDYHEAHTAAVALARRLGREVGLEKFKEYTTWGFLIYSLPRSENRYGHELRCQVVSPDEPLASPRPLPWEGAREVRGGL